MLTAHCSPCSLFSSLLQAATEVWLVSEFCNRSPLLTAIERGAFLTQPSSQYGQPNLISVLQVGRPHRQLPVALAGLAGDGSSSSVLKAGGKAAAHMAALPARLLRDGF
jgi:hypothetical protein